MVRHPQTREHFPLTEFKLNKRLQQQINHYLLTFKGYYDEISTLHEEYCNHITSKKLPAIAYQHHYSHSVPLLICDAGLAKNTATLFGRRKEKAPIKQHTEESEKPTNAQDCDTISLGSSKRLY